MDARDGLTCICRSCVSVYHRSIFLHIQRLYTFVGTSFPSKSHDNGVILRQFMERWTYGHPQDSARLCVILQLVSNITIMSQKS